MYIIYQQRFIHNIPSCYVTLNLLPKIKVEIVTCDDRVNEVLDIITKVSRTGEVGDGKIFVHDIADAIRIRTGERGESAL